MQINKLSKCLVLAPHLVFPTRNGGDILIDRRWAEFSRHVACVDIVAHDRVVRYEEGVLVLDEAFYNTFRSKLYASVRTVLNHSHYLLEKLITVAYERVAKKYLEKNYDVVVFSLISTAALVGCNKYAHRLYCIETQNDEIKWFQDIRNSSLNPSVKLIAWFSERWLVNFIGKVASDFIFLHVSRQDYTGYSALVGNHQGYVAPVGCDLDKLDIAHELIQSESPSRLLFVGSLGVKMNYDAIEYFSTVFEPVLSRGLPNGLLVRVVGSNPSPQVVRLCEKSGWELKSNVSDEELERSYGWADFSILPFSYATGGKLKLLKSLSLGVPFLATTAVAGQLDEVCHPSLVSDSPEEWLAAIREIKKEGISRLQRNELMKVAEKSSWKNIANELYRNLSSIQLDKSGVE